MTPACWFTARLQVQDVLKQLEIRTAERDKEAGEKEKETVMVANLQADINQLQLQMERARSDLKLSESSVGAMKEQSKKELALAVQEAQRWAGEGSEGNVWCRQIKCITVMWS